MEYRRFGTTDYQVSRMGLGCLSMSGMYGPGDDQESLATLERAFELGVNFLDGAVRNLGELSENDNRRRNPRFEPDNFEKNLELLSRVEALAEEKGPHRDTGPPRWASTVSMSSACRVWTRTFQSRSR